MIDAAKRSRHFETVARAIRYIRGHAGRQPRLEEVAAAVHMSPHHLQRVFSDWAGISPKRFLQYLTKEYAKRRLGAEADTLSVAIEAGLSGTSRLHDLMVSCEAMTPGEVRSAGSGLRIGYGFAPSPFGDALVAWTGRGVCHFAFRTCGREEMIAALAVRWQGATLAPDDEHAAALLERIFPEEPARGRIHLVLKGTNFQIKVWEALIRTEFGQVISYSRLARRLGLPGAPRTVGSAVAANSIGFLIPCHRVIREGGAVGDYRWGSERKLALLAWEAAHADEREPGSAAPGDDDREATLRSAP